MTGISYESLESLSGPVPSWLIVHVTPPANMRAHVHQQTFPNNLGFNNLTTFCVAPLYCYLVADQPDEDANGSERASIQS